MSPRKRSTANYVGMPVKRHADVAAFLASPVKTGISSILVNNRWLDILYEDRGYEKTLVYFHATLPAKIDSYPFFGGRKLFADVRANYLGISDPVVGGLESLVTGWYAGSKRVPLQSILPLVLGHVAGDRGAGSLLFFGSSAGGFASLFYGALHPGSATIAINPRTNLLTSPTYFPRYAEASWIGWSTDQIGRRVCTDVASQYAAGTANTVAYLQNRQDPQYFDGHLLPFVKANEKADFLFLELADWGEGHVVPPNEVVLATVNRLANTDGAWASALNDGRFLHAPSLRDVEVGRGLEVTVGE